MFYELDATGSYVSDIHGNATPTVPDWTQVPVPQPIDRPQMVGSRDPLTGEWTGSWVCLGPTPMSDADKPAHYQTQVTARYDAEAQAHGFATHRSLLDRAGYVGDFQSLAQAFGQWIDDCNEICGLATGGVSPSVWPDVSALIASFPAFVAPVPTPALNQPGWYI